MALRLVDTEHGAALSQDGDSCPFLVFPGRAASTIRALEVVEQRVAGQRVRRTFDTRTAVCVNAEVEAA